MHEIVPHRVAKGGHLDQTAAQLCRHAEGLVKICKGRLGVRESCRDVCEKDVAAAVCATKMWQCDSDAAHIGIQQRVQERCGSVCEKDAAVCVRKMRKRGQDRQRMPEEHSAHQNAAKWATKMHKHKRRNGRFCVSRVPLMERVKHAQTMW